MSDPTNARFTIAAGDLPHVREILGERGHEVTDEVEDENGTVSFTLSEANHGGEFEVDVLQEAGIPVIAEHCAGSHYTSGCIAFDGQNRVAQEFRYGGVVVLFLEHLDGVAPESLADARSFFAIRKRALEVMASRPGVG